MIHRVLFIGRWYVDFRFAEDSYDEEEVLSYLKDMGVSKATVSDVLDLMQVENNTGFTVTDPSSFLALVVIGPTTSGEEFINTLVHEVYHLASAIASSLGVNLRGEVPAYIAGDTALSLAELICDMGCTREHIHRKSFEKQ